jgi:hypothetical protein
LKVHPEVDERPGDALPLVFLLLQDEHVVVEELLQLLVREVDAQLLETVKLEKNIDLLILGSQIESYRVFVEKC